jgi:hypothetical protein
MVWEHAFTELRHGAHHFRLASILNSGSVSMRSVDNHKKDPSTWRRIHELESVDEFSSYARFRKSVDDFAVIDRYPCKDRTVNVKDNGAGARMNLVEDLFIFRLSFGRSLIETFQLIRNITAQMRRFAGITRIGFNASYLGFVCGKQAVNLPFRCPCHGTYNHSSVVCDVSICNFLEWFIDLETVYFIVPLRVAHLSIIDRNITWRARLNIGIETYRGRSPELGLKFFYMETLTKDTQNMLSGMASMCSKMARRTTARSIKITIQMPWLCGSSSTFLRGPIGWLRSGRLTLNTILVTTAYMNSRTASRESRFKSRSS